MKKILITLIIILLSVNMTTAQNKDNPLSNEQAMSAAKKLMEFDEQFDNGAPESLKKAKFDEFIDELNPDLSEEDRQKAYDVVNWYIKASKGQKTDISLSEDQQKQVEQMLNETEQKKQDGMQAMMGKVTEIKNMSYSEYKNFVTQNGEIPLPEADIQKAYNQMHQDDGKQVEVVPEKPSNKIDNPVVAIDIIQNPDKHTYKEYRAAMKFIQPDIAEEVIKKEWKKHQK